MNEATLPEGWTVAPLSALSESMGGGTPPTNDKTYWDGAIPWVSPKDMKTFRLRETIDKVSARALGRLKLAPTGTVLVVVRSGILTRTLPVALSEKPVVLNQDVRGFVPHEGVVPAFLAWQLIADSHIILQSCTKDGTTVTSIEAPRFAAHELAIAPTAEQHRIVAQIEHLLEALERATADLNAAKRKLALYRQALLKAAVEGALTAGWRGEDSLATWQTRTIDEIATVGTGTTPSRSNLRNFQGGNVPWITSGALNAERVDRADEFVTREALDTFRLTLYPPGTLLVAMYGEGRTRGKCAELAIEATVNQAVAAIVLRPEYAHARAYLRIFLWHSYESMRDLAAGGVQPNLNLRIIKSIRVPLPPPTEQREIVARLEEQMQGIRQQQVALDRALALAAAQRQNILRAAFSGRLVPQDPSDEPARVLLERIHAERQQSAARGASARRARRAAC